MDDLERIEKAIALIAQAEVMLTDVGRGVDSRLRAVADFAAGIVGRCETELRCELRFHRERLEREVAKQHKGPLDAPSRSDMAAMANDLLGGRR